MPPEEIPPSWRSGGVLPVHAYVKVKKGTEGAQAAMVAGGPQMGKLVWVKPAYPVRPIRQPEVDIPLSEPSTAEDDPAPVRDLLAERRAKHMNRRIARMAELTKELLEACDGKTLSSPILVALAHVFGTNHNCKGVWTYSPASDAWADFEASAAFPPRRPQPTSGPASSSPFSQAACSTPAPATPLAFTARSSLP